MVLQATLVRSSHNPSRGKSSCGTCEYVYYSIHVRDGDQEWLLHRRYSDFWRLDKELQKRNPPIKLGLPEKGVLGIFKLFGGGPRYDELEGKRKKALSQYLESLTSTFSSIGKDVALLDFFGSPPLPSFLCTSHRHKLLTELHHGLTSNDAREQRLAAWTVGSFVQAQPESKVAKALSQLECAQDVQLSRAASWALARVSQIPSGVPSQDTLCGREQLQEVDELLKETPHLSTRILSGMWREGSEQLISSSSSQTTTNS